MKFLGVVATYGIIALILGWGILLAVRGNFWLLGIGFVTYAAALIKIGCLPKKSH